MYVFTYDEQQQEWSQDAELTASDRAAGDYFGSSVAILAVWVATRPAGGAVIIGWYRNATIFRDWQKPPAGAKRRHAGSDFGYYVTAAEEDAILLPKDERLMLLPHGKGGMGQSNVWYADGGSAHQSFRETVQAYVDTRCLPPPISDGPGRQPDPFRRQQVERAAIKTTVAYYTRLGV